MEFLHTYTKFEHSKFHKNELQPVSNLYSYERDIINYTKMNIFKFRFGAFRINEARAIVKGKKLYPTVSHQCRFPIRSYLMML